MNRTQEKLKQALMTAGVSEEKAMEKVLGFGGINLPNEVPRFCPRCNNKLVDVLLIGKRKARYCTNDRITIPYPVDESMVTNTHAFEDFMKETISFDNKGTASVFASVDNVEDEFHRELKY